VVVPSPRASSPIQLEVVRIRELSKLRRHSEALAAAETLALKEPQNRDALYLVAANQRCLNQTTEALTTLERLERQHPRFSLLFQERGYCYTTLGDVPRAIDAFMRAVNLNPALTGSWTMLERLYRAAGEAKGAVAAREQLSMLQRLPPEVVRAGSLFSDGELAVAEEILRAYLNNGGKHAEAFRLLARIEQQCNALDDAERLLEAALQIAPNYRAARLDYVRILLDGQKYLQAHEVVGSFLELEPGNRDLLSLYAAACVGLGRHQSAIEVYRRLLADSPRSAELHVALGHSLQSVGQQKEAISCYQAAATDKPSFGDAYWSLANLKTYRFSEDEIASMLAQEALPAGRPVDRYHFCFALGKAYESQNKYAESWQFYARGNALKRAETCYRPEVIEIYTRKQIEVCTVEFFAARAGFGAPDSDPIFIVGLPRSGSTLIEQILASHSQVHGTQELPDVLRIVRGLDGPRSDPYSPRYPGVLADLGPDEFCALGKRYMSDTRAYRGDKPFFLDKMPNNFRHVGLIHLILPNAKIIDVRREPMACCFSNLKQLFASGQEFSYRMEDIARYYRTYIELMQHWDAVLPGRILRICYEDVVEDLERNVRRLLKFCDLKFEPACLEFYKLDRSVATASSEQVRQPVFRESLLQWRNYEPWLGPLKYHLGDALVRYRE
jgi:tetratricopeptide (TPR) repeat protein